MGYRSDVRLVLAFPSSTYLAEFRARCELEMLDAPPFTREFWEYGAVEPVVPTHPSANHLCIYFSWSNVKWYDSFEEIKFVERMKALCLDCKGAWALGRIGEDDDDIEIEYDTFDTATEPAPAAGTPEREYSTSMYHFVADDHIRVQRQLEWVF